MQNTQSTLSACPSLEQDHDRIETLLKKVENELNAVNPSHHTDALTSTMTDIEAEMNTHFACEEDVLFKAVVPYHPMVLMELEHEMLVGWRDEFIALLNNDTNAKDIDALQTLGHHFIKEMRDHIVREDKGVFPTCEKALSSAEKEHVISGMEKIRQDARNTPTPSISRPAKSYEAFPLNINSTPERAIMSQRIFEEAGLEVKQITVRAGESLGKHWAPKPAMIVCLRGKGTFSANDTETSVTAGTVINMSAQLCHAFSAESTCDLLLVLQNFTEASV